MPSTSQAAKPANFQSWAPGALIAVAMGLLYLAVRPPLFDIDGFPDRLDALEPEAIYDLLQNHILWIPLQMALVSFSRWIGHPTTIPFQVIGILLNCTTLFFLYLLLRRITSSTLFAAVGVLFVAFSPWFWYEGFQNRPYPIVFLAIVLNLMLWNTADGSPPTGLRLFGSAICILAAISMHQGAVVLVPATVLVLLFAGPDSLRRRLIRALAWGGSITVLVAALYLFFWWILGPKESMLLWAAGYAEEIHPPQASHLDALTSLGRATIGFSESLVQSVAIEPILTSWFSAKTVVGLYAGMGILVIAGIAIWASAAGAFRDAVRLARQNALFALSVSSIVFWSAFVVFWEAVTPVYWAPDMFFALVCIGQLAGGRRWRARWILAGCAALIMGWNLYFNLQKDVAYSRNFPEPALASIGEHVHDHDLLITLGNQDWYGDVDYEVIYMSLAHTPMKNRAMAILDDFVVPDGPKWRDNLRNRIDSTLNSGGHVYVAGHVFDPETYSDIASIGDPFSAYVHTPYLRIDGPSVYSDLEKIFANYNREETDLEIGDDDYFELRRK
jgi:hypothetical protein